MYCKLKGADAVVTCTTDAGPDVENESGLIQDSAIMQNETMPIVA